MWIDVGYAGNEVMWSDVDVDVGVVFIIIEFVYDIIYYMILDLMLSFVFPVQNCAESDTCIRKIYNLLPAVVMLHVISI